MTRYEGRPFVLLGVNSDESRDMVKDLVKDGTVTWRSWWDGSTGGPIDMQWQIRGWPTIYIIDHQGNIRFGPQHGTDGLDDVIEKLVQEAEKKPVS